MKTLSNRVALASWLLLLQATGIHASCFSLKNFRSPKTKQKNKKSPHYYAKLRGTFKSLWTLNRGLFTLKRFNLTMATLFSKYWCSEFLMKQIFGQRFIIFEKMRYRGQLLLKLRAIEVATSIHRIWSRST